MRNSLWMIPAGLVLGGMMLVLQRPVSAQNEDAVSALTKRMEAIEKIVVRDNVQPSETHAARIERIEKMLQINAKDAAADQKTDAKTFDELKASLVKTQRDLESLDKRFTQMENNKLDRKTTDQAKEIDALQRSIQQHTTTIREMENRVKKLESVVRP